MKARFVALVAVALAGAGCEIEEVEARQLDWQLHPSRPAHLETSTASAAPAVSSVAISPVSSALSSAPAASASARACGGAGARPCPLQAMMRGGAQAAIVRGDFPAIKKAFEQIAALEPPGFAGWADLAQVGAAAADGEDLAAAKSACAACHAAFRERFRASESRSQPLR